MRYTNVIVNEERLCDFLDTLFFDSIGQYFAEKPITLHKVFFLLFSHFLNKKIQFFSQTEKFLSVF